jgi:hypothetical protein
MSDATLREWQMANSDDAYAGFVDYLNSSLSTCQPTEIYMRIFIKRLLAQNKFYIAVNFSLKSEMQVFNFMYIFHFKLYLHINLKLNYIQIKTERKEELFKIQY